MCFVLGGQRPLRHDPQRVCGADFDDALRRLLAEDDILRLDPPHGRGELVCQQLNEQRVRELLLDFGTHGGGRRAIGERRVVSEQASRKRRPLLQTGKRVSWLVRKLQSGEARRADRL